MNSIISRDNEGTDLDKKAVNNIKSLAIDMIFNAKSGHPGISLSSAPIIYTVYKKHLRFDKGNPNFINRDRFILSAGHGSALLYSTLFMSGFLSLDDLKNFRQLNSNTPGNPEIKTSGVDLSTGLLGQGIASAVGFSIAEKYLNNKFKLRKNKSLIDHYTYVLVSDGDLMEGVSYEACSIAGNLCLNKLIVLYDSNNMTLDSDTTNTFKEKVIDRFKAMGFETILVKDGNNISEIDNAIKHAKKSKKPSFIEIKTILGNGLKLQNTNLAHENILSSSDISLLKEKLGVRDVMFTVYEDNIKFINEEQDIRNNLFLKEWNTLYKKYYNKLKENDKIIFDKLLKNDLSCDLSELSIDGLDLEKSGRDISHLLINEVSNEKNIYMSASADLFSSCKNYLDNKKDFTSNTLDGRNLLLGVREEAMGSIVNGLALNGIRCFASTYLSFSDNLKPSIRMSSMMKLPIIYIFTHDSIEVGEDGPTNQPIEQLAMLRTIPNLDVYRPYDANEIMGSFKQALKTLDKPSAIILSKEFVGIFENTKINGVTMGGYFLNNEESQNVIIASGKEVELAINISKRLKDIGINVSVFSMPCINKFFEEDEKYQKELLKKTRKLVIEYSNDPIWYRIVNNKKNIMSINEFGKSGKKNDVLKSFSLDEDSLYIKSKKIFK